MRGPHDDPRHALAAARAARPTASCGSTRGRVARRPRAALDPALPQLERLLDPEAMRDVLARSLRDGAGSATSRVSRVVYKPRRAGRRPLPRAIDGARTTPSRPASPASTSPSARARPALRELARGASTAARRADPLTYDAEAERARDLAAVRPAAARARPSRPTSCAARGSAPIGGGEPELIGYKPRGARGAAPRTATCSRPTGASASSRRRSPACCAPRAAPLPHRATSPRALPELRLTAQRARRAATRPPRRGRRRGRGRRAGRRRCSAPTSRLPRAAPPERQLDAARPQGGGRRAPCCRELRAAARRARARGSRGALPARAPLVPAHGDFHVDQLLRRRATASRSSTSTGCALAAPALDLATYAADVVRGRDGDLEAVHAVLEPLLAGLRRPAGRPRLAPRGGGPRPRRAPVPAPGRRTGASAWRRWSPSRRRACLSARSSPAAPASSARTSPSRCSPTATRCSASTASTTTTTRADKRANLARGARARRLPRSSPPTSRAADVERAARRLRRRLPPRRRAGRALELGPALRPLRAQQRRGHAAAARGVQRRAPERRFVYASSSSVYGDAEALPTREDAHAAAALALRRDQARRRAAVPALPRRARRRRRRAALLLRLRPAPAARHGVPALLRGRARARAPIEIFGDGRQTRDFTFVGDVVAATRAAAARRRRRAARSTTSAAARGSASTSTLELLAAIAGRPLDVRRDERESGDVLHTGADIARARAELGFEPATTLEDGLRAEFEWARSARPAALPSAAARS